MPSHTQQQYLQFSSSHNSKSRGRGGRRPKEEEDCLPPEETEKRKQRRLRNKEAAARCRQRRLDHMQDLQGQVDTLDEQLRNKEEEIERLKAEKAELEHIFRTHECKINGTPGFPSIQTTKFMKKIGGFGPSGGFGRVKAEPTLTQVVTESDDLIHNSTPITTIEEAILSRPNTLTFGTAGATGTTPATLGFSTDTPSNGMYRYGASGMDLLGPPTGLTPMTNLGHFLATSGSMLETPTASMDTTDGGVVIKTSLCEL